MKALSILSLSFFLLFLSACQTTYYGKLDKTPYNTKACNKKLRKHAELKSTLVDKILVYKKKRILKTFAKGKYLNSFRISLGKNGDKGHKIRQGDYRTPEGKYKIIRKKCDKRLYKSLLISYPNSKDRANARKKSVNVGGYITIHGQPKWNAKGIGDDYTLSNDWTEGCIAVTNRAMDSLWSTVKNGVKIEIYP
jgi:murein L,D-transpeptidase YafK